MPTTWPLSPTAVVAPGVIDAESALAPDSPIDIGVPRFFSQVDFLAMVGRLYPDWYIEPLKSNGCGYELLQAYGKLFAAVSHGVGEYQVLSTLEYSSGGQRASASVQFFRQSLATDAFTVKAGSLVATSKTNRRYMVVADLVFGSGDYLASTLVQSLGKDSDYNVPGPIVLQDGTRLLGEIDSVVFPVLDPPFAEPNIQVRQLSNAYGGCAPVLDQLGDDRGIQRSANEADSVYKKRARALPDTVTPAAIRRHLDAIFYPISLHYDLIETWEGRYQSCWNAPVGGPIDPIFGRLVNFAFSDPRTNVFVPRWMGENDHRGAMVLVVPTFPTLADRGMAYNDPATGPDASRAVSAWNAPVTDGLSLSGVWNGEDDSGENSRARFLHSTYDLMRSIKGGGAAVAFIPAEATEPLPGAPYP